jgi:hypothetical protein
MIEFQFTTKLVELKIILDCNNKISFKEWFKVDVF